VNADSHGAPRTTGGQPVRRAAIGTGVVVALLLGLLVYQEVTGSGEGVRSELIGRAAPAVVGTATDGTVVDLDRWRGSWVVVNFFATWCVPCVREHPELVAFAERHTDDNVEVVSIAFEDDAEAVAAFFAERGGDWPVIIDGVEGVALDYGVRGVPESFLITPAGQVAGLFYGVTADALDDAIAAFEASGLPTTPTGDRPTSGGAP